MKYKGLSLHSLVSKWGQNIPFQDKRKNDMQELFVYKAYWKDKSTSITIANSKDDALFFFDTEGDVSAIEKVEIYDIESSVGIIIKVPKDEDAEIVVDFCYSELN